ncbi:MULTISPECIES: hypothetical protein [Methylomonas]|uniref:hypothetical protein n=1 Tax=Methylomonas TaxID=416 RepID=UPI000B16C8CE|nr:MULTISPECIES: hypothetical protein [Methylomonas]NJA04552.1 hypothetical protein [Methylococcaceae bacterium WWC4]
MKKADSLYRDIATGAFFSAGIFGLVLEQWLLSMALFGAAALASNLQPAKPARAMSRF